MLKHLHRKQFAIQAGSLQHIYRDLFVGLTRALCTAGVLYGTLFPTPAMASVGGSISGTV